MKKAQSNLNKNGMKTWLKILIAFLVSVFVGLLFDNPYIMCLGIIISTFVIIKIDNRKKAIISLGKLIGDEQAKNVEKVLGSTSEIKKFEILFIRYRDIDIALKVVQKRIWIGMTENQLLDSWGYPDDDGEIQYTRKNTRHVYKYNRIRVNSYADKITLEDGIVTKIDRKTNY